MRAAHALVLALLESALASRLNFAPNITRGNTRWPPTMAWETICENRGVIAPSQPTDSAALLAALRQPTSHDAADFVARLKRDLAARRVLCDEHAPCTVDVHEQPPILNVSGRVGGLVVRICLPHAPSSAHYTRHGFGLTARRPMLCEPYGEMWQQLGGEVSRFASRRTARYKLLGNRREREAFEEAATRGAAMTQLPERVTAGKRARVPTATDGRHASDDGIPGCATFDLSRLVKWLDRLRSTAPFVRGHGGNGGGNGGATASNHDGLSSSSGGDNDVAREPLESLLIGKAGAAGGGGRVGGRRRAHAPSGVSEPTDAEFAAEFRSWMHASPSASTARTFTPRQYASCAVVGSGHDLRCGASRGGEIDRHDAVFRSNTFQHRRRERGFESSRHAPALRRHAIEEDRGGRRTTFRVNCLFDGHASLPLPRAHTPRTHADTATEAEHETCVVARSWFTQRWGREGMNNLGHPCCSNSLLRSSYNLSQLRLLEGRGARFAFFSGVPSGDDTVDGMLRGSGGNALHSALALCSHVDVYGSGLYAAGADADKIYAHAYDHRVGRCLEPGTRVYEFGNQKGLAGFFGWRRDRIRTEMLLHLLHAMGAVRWVQ